MAAKRDEKRTKKVRDKSAEKMQGTVITWVIVALLLIVGILTYSFIKPKNIGSDNSTMVARQGSIESKIKTTALIVRDEKIVVTPISGAIHYLVDDNSKVSANTDVVEILDSEMSSVTRSNSAKIEQEINNFIAKSKLEKNQARDMLNEVRVQIATKESQLNIYEQSGDIKNVNKLKTEISELHIREIDYLNEISRIDTEISDAAELLEDSKASAQARKDNVLMVLKNSEPAIISRKSDGMEHILRPDSPEILDYVLEKDVYYFEKFQDNVMVDSGQAVFREIKNYQTFVLVQIQTNEEMLKKDGKIAVRFPKLATEAVDATVINFKCVDEDKGLYSVFIALERFATSLVDLRTQECEVILKTFSGVVIKNSCIVTRDGVKGVMVLKGSDYRFVEVNIVGSNLEESAVTGIKDGDKLILRP